MGAFSPFSKAGSLPSLPGSTRSSIQNGHSSMQSVLASRKDVALTANTKMKQLQWDKVPQQSVGKTVWKDDEASKEQEWVQKLMNDGVWREMEEDFRAKQLVLTLMGAKLPTKRCCWDLIFPVVNQKKAELKSVLDPQTKKRVGKSTRIFEIMS
jgi:cytokinesis protein